MRRTDRPGSQYVRKSCYLRLPAGGRSRLLCVVYTAASQQFLHVFGTWVLAASGTTCSTTPAGALERSTGHPLSSPRFLCALLVARPFLTRGENVSGCYFSCTLCGWIGCPRYRSTLRCSCFRVLLVPEMPSRDRSRHHRGLGQGRYRKVGFLPQKSCSLGVCVLCPLAERI